MTSRIPEELVLIIKELTKRSILNQPSEVLKMRIFVGLFLTAFTILPLIFNMSYGLLTFQLVLLLLLCSYSVFIYTKVKRGDAFTKHNIRKSYLHLLANENLYSLYIFICIALSGIGLIESSIDFIDPNFIYRYCVPIYPVIFAFGFLLAPKFWEMFYMNTGRKPLILLKIFPWVFGLIIVLYFFILFFYGGQIRREIGQLESIDLMLAGILILFASFIGLFAVASSFYQYLFLVREEHWKEVL